MKVGFYAGSFDPFTNGHLHVIEKSANAIKAKVIETCEQVIAKLSEK